MAVIVFLGACVTLGAYLLYNWSVTQVKVTLAAAYVNLIPVFTLLLAYLLLGRPSMPCNGWPAAPCCWASRWGNCRPGARGRRPSPPRGNGRGTPSNAGG